MNDITALAQREKFEAWLEEAEALPWGYLKKRRTSDDAYHEPGITDMWGAWQAASAEMVEALEKAQQYAKERDEENQGLMLTVGRLRVERETMESRTVTVKLADYRASYKEPFALEIEHHVRKALKDVADAAGINVEAE